MSQRNKRIVEVSMETPSSNPRMPPAIRIEGATSCKDWTPLARFSAEVYRLDGRFEVDIIVSGTRGEGRLRIGKQYSEVVKHSGRTPQSRQTVEIKRIEQGKEIVVEVQGRMK